MVRTKVCRVDVRYWRIQRGALAEHSMATGHRIDWEDVEILKTEDNWKRRKTKESWNIRMKKSKLNRDQGTLEELYRVIIQDRRRRSRTRKDQRGTKRRKKQKQLTPSLGPITSQELSLV